MNSKHNGGVSNLDRREFMKLGGLGAVATAVVGSTACEARNSQETVNSEGSWWVNETFELEEATFSGLAEDMASGRRTSVEITQLYLDRIAALDREGPRLRSIIETNSDALLIAKELDEERENGVVRSPLHGIPIVLKDNIDTADLMTTTAGSYALEGHVAAKDSHVATKLES